MRHVSLSEPNPKWLKRQVETFVRERTQEVMGDGQKRTFITRADLCDLILMALQARECQIYPKNMNPYPGHRGKEPK